MEEFQQINPCTAAIGTSEEILGTGYSVLGTDYVRP
jgi:hypothetical protein